MNYQPENTTLTPNQLRIPAIGMFGDTMGKAELEAAAAVIVRWHHVNSNLAWKEFTGRETADFLASDPIARQWANSPFWRPDPRALVEQGYAEGWEDADAPVRITKKFIDALTKYGPPNHGREAP